MTTKHNDAPKYTEEALQLAIADVESGKYKYQEAADRRGVPKSTLYHRLHGRKERHKAHEHEQALSPSEESEIVLWCQRMERHYLPVRLSHVIGCAEMIWNTRCGTSGNHLGANWIEGFMKRHPELKVTTSKRIDERRVMAKNPIYIMEFYVLLSNICQKLNIPPANKFNMDEKGFRIGMLGSEKVVIVRRNPDRTDGYAGGAKQSGDRETITSIDCIGADGTVLPPMIIMKGKNVQKSWAEGSPLPQDTHWAASLSGWTNNELGVEYIKAFDAWTAEKASEGKWRLLIVDGHGSHLTYGFLHYAYEARIMVLGLPSHTTDFLQPLDRVIFRVLQRFYAQAVDKRARDMLTINKKNFAEVLHEARERTYTPELITSAFEATGIEPLDAYRTTVMRDFRARIVEEHSRLKSNDVPLTSAHQNPRQLRQMVIEDCRAVLDNVNADIISLRRALTDALAVVDGAEARALLAESELGQLRSATRARAGTRARRGRVGRARVYTQAEIERVLEEEKSRATSAPTKGRGRGRGRARGRGRGARSVDTDQGYHSNDSSDWE